MNDGFSVDNRSGDDLKRLLEKHFINHRKLSKILNIDRSLMYRWLNNKTKINKFVWVILLMMCDEIIMEDVFDIGDL